MNVLKTMLSITSLLHSFQRTIVLSSPELVRDAFNEPALAGKIDEEAFTMLTDGQHGKLREKIKSF